MRGHLPEKQGMVVEVKTQRKSSNGKTAGQRFEGERRNGKTGVVAYVYDSTGECIDKVPSPTFKSLSTKLRRKYHIHPTVHIAKKGKTEF
jgi:hypothetical protein